MKKYLLKRGYENLILIIIIFLGGVLKVGSAYFIGNAFNYLIKYNLNEFVEYIQLSGIMFILYLIFMYIKIPYENYVAQKMITDIRVDIINSIIRNNYKNFYKRNTGNYISWLSNDLMLIEQKGFSNLFQLITFIIEASIAIVGLLSFHWSIILFSLTMSFVTLILPKIVQKKIEKKSREYSESLENFTSKNSDFLQGFDVLLSYNKLKIMEKVVKKTSRDILDSSVSLRKSVAAGAVLGGLGNVVSQIGMITLTGYLAIKNIVGFGSILTVEALSSTIFNSVSNIMNVTIELRTIIPIFDKFEEYTKESNKESNEILDKVNKKIGTISLENVTYSYDSKIILDKFNYTFEEQKKYAIIGESGSGKSTLLKLLTGRILGYTGNIKFGDIELKNMREETIMNELMYISQDPYIFSESLRFNLTLGENYSDDELGKVLDKVGLGNLTFEEGLDTILGENGRNLSGGQKQRISLARGLLTNKKILLLDEITSNQDLENARKIEELVLNDKNLTTIMITHRINDMDTKLFDGIINLDKKH